MAIKDILNAILNELKNIVADLEEEQLVQMAREICTANQIFIAGAGRSLMMIRGLAMRLMQMGFTVYVVGETTTPALEINDLLVVASGSGETSTLIAISRKCKQIGGRLVLITTNPTSTLAQMADAIVEVKTSSTKVEKDKKKTKQLGANAFEQSVLLITDAVVMKISASNALEKSNELLMKKHANLE